MNRRTFLKTTGAGAGALAMIPFANALAQGKPEKGEKGMNAISQLQKNTAIAMWDFTWLLRHHPEGAFLNWDRALEGLAERGYDSIRIDCFPNYVAADTDGRLQDEFSANGNPEVLWGAGAPMTFRPREALLEFLPKCKKYGIKVGLATWFMRLDTGTGRTAIYTEEGGVLRAWKETLAFLDKHRLLDDNIMYVDLLNEYPDWNGYDWLKTEMNKRGDVKQYKIDNPNAHIPDESAPKPGSRNALQQELSASFLNNLIEQMRASYPALDYFASISSSYGHVDMSRFAAIDRHVWFSDHGTGLCFGNNVGPKADYKRLLAYWNENKAKEIAWMDQQITKVSDDARKHKIVCGNTEGWGSVGWRYDVDWVFIKEAAEICVDLALKHDNYRFICTSNFTHPHFGFWEDIPWHKRITAKIKGGAR